MIESSFSNRERVSFKTKDEIISKVFSLVKTRILSIVVIGSRGKNLFNNESDYDLRVVTLDNIKNYILQTPIHTHKLGKIIIKDNNSNKNEDNKVEIDGKTIDVIDLFRYSYKTNSFASEIIKGLEIYSDEEIRILPLLKESFIKNINSKTIINQIVGLINSDFKKINKESKENKANQVKSLCEIVYLYLSLEYYCKYKEKWLNVYQIQILNEVVSYINFDNSLLEEEFKEYLNKIVNLRVRNKSSSQGDDDECYNCYNKAVFDFIIKRISDIKSTFIDNNCQLAEEGNENGKNDYYENILYEIILKN